MSFGWPRIHVPEIESTMPVLATLAALGAAHGTVLTCDFQTRGVGRQGRSWHAPTGSSLLMSVLLRTSRPPSALPLLSVLTAGAVAETVASFGATSRVKWPNDVLVDGRKISGILLRSHASAGGTVVVAGIGLNLLQSAELDGSAASLETACGIRLSHQTLLDVLLPTLDTATSAFEADETRSRLDALRGRLAFAGEMVDLQTAEGALSGTVVGLADSGALRLQGDEGSIREIHSGEVVRGPRRSGASGR